MNKTPAHEGPRAVMLLVRAKNRLHDRQFDQALEDLNEALRLHSNLGEALMVRATVRIELGEFQQALEDVERRLQIDPPEPLALLTRGNLRACLGAHEPALADFNAFLEQQPATTFALRARANAYARLRRYEEAIADLNTAQSLEPAVAETYLERGRTYQDMGCYRAALTDYRKALELGPNQAEICNQFAWMLAACPQREFRDGVKAEQIARRACELSNWEDGNLIDTLACAYAECGQFDEALRWSNKSLEKASAENAEAIRRHVQLFQSGQPARFEMD